MEDLETRFQQALERVHSLPSRPADGDLLTLYGLYKQATEGEERGPRPGVLRPVQRAKWDAWAAVAGLDPDEARRRYIAEVDRLQAELA